MTRKAQIKRVSKFAIAALTVIAGAGLFHGSFFRFRAQRYFAWLDRRRGSDQRQLHGDVTFGTSLMPNVIVNAGQHPVTGPNPQRKLTGSDAIGAAFVRQGEAGL